MNAGFIVQYPPSASRPRKGFTILELLAVLTVISIALVLILGSYTSWATSHALRGAVTTVEAGLNHARSMAKANSTYVLFYYGSTNIGIKAVSEYQIFISTNTTDTSLIETTLVALTGRRPDRTAIRNLQDANSAFYQQFERIGTTQRLCGHVTIGYFPEGDLRTGTFNPDPVGLCIFRPDGSVWSWSDVQTHYLLISTRQPFSFSRTETSPLRRIIGLDLATGLTTIIEPTTP